MGKGAGCVPSKKRLTAADNTPRSASEPGVGNPNPPIEEDKVHSSSSSAAAAPVAPKHIRLFIVFYSMYGHVEGLARRVKMGVDGVHGVEGLLYRVPETLPPQVLHQMNAPHRSDGDDDDNIPVLAEPADLAQADAFLFGFPTRYGSMAAQMKAFFDSTGQLWREQRLAGKPAGFFVSTGTQGGGQETSAWTAITQLAHHGMLFVPIGYTFGAGMFKMDPTRGGSPYGAGVFAGDGTREPSEMELALAEHQGKYMAGVVKKLMSPS